MRSLAPAFILPLLALATGMAVAQSQSTNVTGSTSTTVTNEQTQAFISRFEAPVRACIERCIEGHPITASSTTLTTDGSTWTLQQFESQFDPPVRVCIDNCGAYESRNELGAIPARPATK